MTVICPRCNAQSSDDALYCTVCGMTLVGQSRNVAQRDTTPLSPSEDANQPPSPVSELASESAPTPQPAAPTQPEPAPEQVSTETSSAEASVPSTGTSSWQPVPAWVASRDATAASARGSSDDAGRTGDDDEFVPLKLPDRSHGRVRGVMDGGTSRALLAGLGFLLILLIGVAVAWGSGRVDNPFGGADPTPTMSALAPVVAGTPVGDIGTPTVPVSTPAANLSTAHATPTPVAVSPSVAFAQGTPAATPRATPAPTTSVAPATSTAQTTGTPGALAATPAVQPTVTEPARATVDPAILADSTGGVAASAAAVVATEAPVATPAPATPALGTPVVPPGSVATPTQPPASQPQAPVGDGTGGAPLPTPEGGI